MAKCGEIYAWHWQHTRHQECDPWHEPETIWHRKWKSRFPDCCQEVIIERYGEKHRADIQAANGIVIEFQHSSISSSTIRIREHFYEKMIWVVDASGFKDNFKLRSVVTSKLKVIEYLASNAIHDLEAEYDEKLKDVQSRIDKNRVNYKEKSDEISYKNKKLEVFNDVLKSFSAFADNIVCKWKDDENYYEHATYEITNAVSEELKQQLKDTNQAIRVAELAFKTAHESLARINDYEDYQIAAKTYKLISYAILPSTVYYKTKAISKTSITTLFPFFVSFNNEKEFKDFAYKEDLFYFVIDPTESVASLNLKILESAQKIENHRTTLLEIKHHIADELLNALRNRTFVLEEEIKGLINELNEFIRRGDGLTERQRRFISEKEHELSQSAIIIQKEKEELEYKTMNEKKGEYTFRWKNERKSWQAAEKEIYFDVGEDYLWKYITDGKVKKIKIVDFLNGFGVFR